MGFLGLAILMIDFGAGGPKTTKALAFDFEGGTDLLASY